MVRLRDEEKRELAPTIHRLRAAGCTWEEVAASPDVPVSASTALAIGKAYPPGSTGNGNGDGDENPPGLTTEEWLERSRATVRDLNERGSPPAWSVIRGVLGQWKVLALPWAIRVSEHETETEARAEADRLREEGPVWEDDG